MLHFQMRSFFGFSALTMGTTKINDFGLMGLKSKKIFSVPSLASLSPPHCTPLRLKGYGSTPLLPLTAPSQHGVSPTPLPGEPHLVSTW